MVNTAQQKDPPDKQNLANILKSKGDQLVKKNHQQLPQIKSRWFDCRLRNDKLRQFIVEKYSHVKVCSYGFSRNNNRNFVVLHVGFDISSDAGKAEYEDSKQIILQSGTVIKSVPDEKLDGDQYFPRPLQKIYLDNVPFKLFASSRNQLKDALGEYVEYYEADMWEWISENGVFTGKISVEVKSIKNPPPRTLEMAFNGSTTKIWTLTRGFNTKIKLEVDDLATVVCHSCKQTGHLAKNCSTRKNRIFSWKCTKCGGHSFNTGCRENSCQQVLLKEQAATAKAKTPIIQRLQSEPGNACEREMKYIYTEDKINRRMRTLTRLRLPRTKDDEVYKQNKLKLLEMKAIKIALKSCSQGLVGFAEAYDKRLAEYAGLLGAQPAVWHAKNDEDRRNLGVDTMTDNIN